MKVKFNIYCTWRSCSKGCCGQIWRQYIKKKKLIINASFRKATDTGTTSLLWQLKKKSLGKHVHTLISITTGLVLYRTTSLFYRQPLRKNGRFYDWFSGTTPFLYCIFHHRINLPKWLVLQNIHIICPFPKTVYVIIKRTVAMFMSTTTKFGELCSNVGQSCKIGHISFSYYQ